MSWQTDFSQLIDDTDVSLSRLKGVLGHSPRRRSSHLGRRRPSDTPFDPLFDEDTFALSDTDDASLSGIAERQKTMLHVMESLGHSVSRLQTENKELASQLSRVQDELSPLRLHELVRESSVDAEHKLGQFRREILGEVHELQRRVQSQKPREDDVGRSALDSHLLSAEVQELRSFVRHEMESQKRDVDSLRTRLRKFESDSMADTGSMHSLERRVSNLEQDIFHKVVQRSPHAADKGVHGEMDRIKSRLRSLSDQVARLERGLQPTTSGRCSDLEGDESLSSSSSDSLCEDDEALSGRAVSEDLDELLEGVL